MTAKTAHAQFTLEWATIGEMGGVTDNGSLLVVGQAYVGPMSGDDYSIDAGSVPAIPDTSGDVDTCSSTADCADLDGNGIRDDNCLFWACDAGTCVGTEIIFGDMGGQFGECPVDGTADGNDRFHALNCFANTDPNGGGLYTCEDDAPAAFNVDAGGQFGSCSPDGVCDGNDAFAALNAFGGTSACGCPLDGAPAPEFDGPMIVDEVVVELVPSSNRVLPGDSVDVDVYITGGVADLRGYQLHVATTGTASLELTDMAVDARSDHAFAGESYWDAYNVETGQLVVGIDADGIRSRDNLYLATLTYTVRGGHDLVMVDLLHDDGDPTQRTFLFATPANGKVAIVETIPAVIEIGGRPMKTGAGKH